MKQAIEVTESEVVKETKKIIPSSTKLSLPVAKRLRPARFAFGQIQQRGLS